MRDAVARWFGHGLPPPRLLLRTVLGRTLVILLALALGYVGIANWALGKLAGWATGEDFFLSYDRAHTLWPGRVEVENLRLRTSDSNVQIELRVARAIVDVDLLALAKRRFHAHWAETHGTEFRLRHKHGQVGDAALRIAAYPEIPGFEGPPLRDVGPPAPLGETWTVRMENVTARVTRLWFVEYHYSGPALAQGAFEFHPGRFLDLEPSRLDFEGGALRVGDEFVARELTGTVHARIEPTRIEPIEGSAIFFPITTRADLELQGGELAFTDVYLGGRVPLAVQGPLRGTVRGGLLQGALTPDTRIELTSNAATVHLGSTEFSGDWSFRLDVDADRAPATLRLSAAADRSVASDGGPRLEELEAAIAFRPLEVYEPMQRERFAVSIGSLEVPDLGWFAVALEGSGLELGGRARLALDYADDVSKGRSGELDLSYEDVELSHEGTRVGASGRLDARFVGEEGTWAAMKELHWVLQRGQLELDGERWGPWALELRSNSTRLLQHPLALQSTVDLSLSRAGGLLELALPDLPAQLAASVFGVEDLEGRLSVYVDSKRRRLEVTKLRSGDVEASGAWTATGKGASGSFAFETSVADFQVLLEGGQSELRFGSAKPLSLAESRRR